MAEQICCFEAASYPAEIEALLDPAKLLKRIDLGTATMPSRTSVAGARAEADLRAFGKQPFSVAPIGLNAIVDDNGITRAGGAVAGRRAGAMTTEFGQAVAIARRCVPNRLDHRAAISHLAHVL